MLRFLIMILMSTITLFSAEKAILKGLVVDAETGEAMPGVNITIENSKFGAETDLDGFYYITGMGYGLHNVKAQMIGYGDKIYTGVNLTDKVTTLNIKMNQKTLELEEVVLIARAENNNETALLSKRQRAIQISDAISTDAISNLGINNAAGAMSKVTGVTVENGKYIYVRGLGERYTQTHLNGVELPKSDPDRNAFQMDLFSSNILDNITTLKTFTPDKPGNFSGGIVDINTKSYPDQTVFKFSAGSSYNSNLKDKIIGYKGSDTDWLGFDDGKRDIPSSLKNGEIPSKAEAPFDYQKATTLSKLSKDFNNQMSTENISTPMNQSYSLTYGDSWKKDDVTIGFVGGLNYSRNAKYYDNGELKNWQLTGGTSSELVNNYSFNENYGSDAVQLGAIMQFSAKVDKNNEFGTNVIFSKIGESSARFIDGHYYDGNMDDTDIYETRVLKYSDRQLISSQVTGEHFFPGFGETRLSWNGSYAISTNDEPDMRTFSDHYSLNDDGEKVYRVSPSLYTEPSRYYRNMEEGSYNFDLKYVIPFNQWYGMRSVLKIGAGTNVKDRNFDERIFRYTNLNYSSYSYNGDPEEYFSQNVGIMDSLVIGNFKKYIMSNVIIDASEDRANYEGYNNNYSGFIMADLPIFTNLRFVGGARYETTEMEVETDDERPEYKGGKITKQDILPSANLIYSLQENMNLRTSYGRTLARPTLREMAPFSSFDYVGGYFFTGNQDLKRTTIDNYDLRFEWFTNPGEIVAISGFYKNFKNPIERVILNNNGEIQPQNVDEAITYGFEIELRKKLDFISEAISDFSITSNYTYIQSRVDIPEEELLAIRAYNPDAKDYRELQGQSPYIVNVGLSYDNLYLGTSSTLSFNIFGERLSEVSEGATPNIYEQPRPELNFSISQRLFDNYQLKFSARNITDEAIEKVQHFKGKDYIQSSHKDGRSFSLSFGYNLQ
ncbi:MAG: TonB-dependent receptor [Candidatus Delongbacteria bacterium]|nr:TonB-dependent receptor [Candidatus Delongbacteria bacterium]MBN2836550.1 TonB-dependent receptor [Candidatus Delongbacteria bacterium]